MSVQNEFKSVLQQSFSNKGVEPVIEMNMKGNVQLELLFKLNNNIYHELFEFAEVDCFLRNRHFIEEFTKRVISKLDYSVV